MDFNNKSSIDIITGPMFSGKTTELVRRLTIFVEAGMNVLYVNSILDTRQFISHNKHIRLNMAHTTTDFLKNILEEAMMYDVIGIDEAQFFEDLAEISIELSEKYSRKVIIAGLNSDFRREKFGKICDLLPLCDTITKLYPFCDTCAKKKILNPALFSKRTSDSCDKISIGASDSYVPVCRSCYNL